MLEYVGTTMLYYLVLTLFVYQIFFYLHFMRISQFSYTFEDATSLYVKFQYCNMLFADEKKSILSLGLLKMGKYCNLKLILCESDALEIIS
jgi:hypothetical protein